VECAEGDRDARRGWTGSLRPIMQVPAPDAGIAAIDHPKTWLDTPRYYPRPRVQSASEPMKTSVQLMAGAAAATLLLSGCVTTMMAAAALNEKVSCMSEPDTGKKPATTYAEFPFRLTYEKQGETFVVEDTLICQYEGRHCSSTGREDVWRSTIAGRDNIVIHSVSDKEKYLFSVGRCERALAGIFPKADEDPQKRIYLAGFKNGREITTDWDAKMGDRLKSQGIVVTGFEMRPQK